MYHKPLIYQNCLCTFTGGVNELVADYLSRRYLWDKISEIFIIKSYDLKFSSTFSLTLFYIFFKISGLKLNFFAFSC